MIFSILKFILQPFKFPHVQNISSKGVIFYRYVLDLKILKYQYFWRSPLFSKICLKCCFIAYAFMHVVFYCCFLACCFLYCCLLISTLPKILSHFGSLSHNPMTVWLEPNRTSKNTAWPSQILTAKLCQAREFEIFIIHIIVQNTDT